MLPVSLIKNRIRSIDIVRGVVMVIMALDHVRAYFHITAISDDPLNLNTTTPQLFFTRWITHFCAPVFVFLSGTSIYLLHLKKTTKELRIFLIKRGAWIIFVGIVLINFGWSFDPFYRFILLDVLWAIGISMVIMSLLIGVNYNIILAIGLVIVFGHNLLDYPEAAMNGNVDFWYAVLYYGKFASYHINNNHTLIIAYPFLAWTGVMIVGYCFGKLYRPAVDAVTRQKLLFRLGFCIILLFIILRLFNHYGDPYPWRMKQDRLYTLLSFLKVHKYPPSLMYLCITLGPAMILLALAEKIQNKITAFFNVFGKVPMFYFVIHLYLIHFICVIFYFFSGYKFDNAYNPQQAIAFRPAQFGYSLTVVYLIWILIVLIMYPLCKKYGRYKSTHDKWWLSYW